MITFTDLTEPAAERCVDRQLWLACAGRMCTVPPVGASVYYCAQGHAEHVLGLAGVGVAAARVPAPPLVPCRVAAVRYMANADTDEVFAKIRLVPLRGGEADACGLDDDDAAADRQEEKLASFAKTLTQSDASNAGLSVPKYCAETTFPRLDYTADPPAQTVVAKDVHGAVWTFRHIYRGKPRRHLLTTGWSKFVSHKKLVAGDSIVFLRGDSGDDLHVGIRRAKRAKRRGGRGEEAHTPGCDHYAGMRGGNVIPCAAAMARGMVRPEDVAAAARLAAAGQPFEAVYYPRASTPQFFVRAAAVRAAMRVPWSAGMRFKMAFETEDSSRITWFVGTVAGVQVTDRIRWPRSPWRLLQVTWDEPDLLLLQNVKRVNPWLVELVSSMPVLSPPCKKRRIPAYSEFPLEGQSFNPLPHGHQQQQQLRRPDHAGPTISIPASISTDLALGRTAPVHDAAAATCALSNKQKPDAVKPPGLVLFGQTILTEQQMSLSSSNVSEGSGSGVIQSSLQSQQQVSELLGLEPGQCKATSPSGNSHVHDVCLDLSLLTRAQVGTEILTDAGSDNLGG